MKPVLTFDLNGTLTDTSALNPIFMRYFGQAERRHEWFAQLIELAMTCAATAEYIPFGKLADAALRMLAIRHQAVLTAADIAEFMEAVRSLPVFPDVPAGLDDLRAAGFRAVVLTNSARATGEYTLQRAGVRFALQSGFADRPQSFIDNVRKTMENGLTLDQALPTLPP